MFQIQYDYCSAYLDFFSESTDKYDFDVAREVCKKYLKYPVLSWRKLFVDVHN